MIEFEEPPKPPAPIPGSFEAPASPSARSSGRSRTSDGARSMHSLRFLNPAANFLLAAALLCTVAGWWRKGELPDARDIQSELRHAPQQQSTERAPFDFLYRGERYTVEPLADYEMAGLIVSHNNPQGWGDIYHDASSVDFRDLCVIWGPNVADNNFHNFEYWSESWTCNIRTARQEVYEQFDPRALSNNHLLTNDAQVEAVIQSARIGDQIWLKGMLVSYYLTGMKPMARTSSLTRNDTGNGACEVLFVEEASILKRGPSFGHLLYRSGLLALLVGIVAKLICLFFVPLRYYRANNG